MRVICILGMHRSGTSAVAGLVQEQGVDLGPASVENTWNPRGNRENPKIVRLHERILEQSGGTWWRPPPTGEIAILPGHRRRRNQLLRDYFGDIAGVKDPRLLLVLDLWRDLEPGLIGVIRNPVAVRRSLERRAAGGRRNVRVEPEGWEELWRVYNSRLLAELEREAFPVVDFDRPGEVVEQVLAALEAHGVPPSTEAQFYDPGLTSQTAELDRDEVLAPETLELWDALVAHAHR